MKRAIALCALLAVLLVFAAPVYAAEKSIAGTVSSVNMDQKTMVVKDGKGVEHTILWNDGTQLAGGPLEQGASLKVKVFSDRGKLIASSIDVQKAPKSSKPAPQEQK